MTTLSSKRRRGSLSSRDRLIQSAATLFYESGIHQTSVDAVVAHAGLTKPTLYAHFPSKDDLIEAVAEYRDKNWHAAIEARVTEAQTPAGKLLAVFEFLEDFIEDSGFRGCALVNLAVEIHNPVGPGKGAARSNKQKNRARIKRLVREAGLMESAALASALSLLFEGAIVTAYVEGDAGVGRTARQAAEHLIRNRSES